MDNHVFLVKFVAGVWGCAAVMVLAMAVGMLLRGELSWFGAQRSKAQHHAYEMVSDAAAAAAGVPVTITTTTTILSNATLHGSMGTMDTANTEM